VSTEQQQPVHVGIDVSKTTLDVAIEPTREHWQVSNDDRGIQQLTERLGQLRPERIVLEATGGYELPALAALGCAAVAVNPRQVRDFAKALGQLAQTGERARRLATAKAPCSCDWQSALLVRLAKRVARATGKAPCSCDWQSTLLVRLPKHHARATGKKRLALATGKAPCCCETRW
jgi:transposase